MIDNFFIRQICVIFPCAKPHKFQDSHLWRSCLCRETKFFRFYKLDSISTFMLHLAFKLKSSWGVYWRINYGINWGFHKKDPCCILSRKVSMLLEWIEDAMFEESIEEYRRHIAGPAQKCRIIIIFEKSQFGKTNFNLHYFD
jgi:hypothetical protein